MLHLLLFFGTNLNPEKKFITPSKLGIIDCCLTGIQVTQVDCVAKYVLFEQQHEC